MKTTITTLFLLLLATSLPAQWDWSNSTAEDSTAAIAIPEPAPDMPPMAEDIEVDKASDHWLPAADDEDGSEEDYPRPGLIPFDFNQSGKAESYPFISNDGLHLLFTHNQSEDWIFYSHRNSVSDGWSVPVPLEFTGVKELEGFSKGEAHARLLSGAFYLDENTLYICGSWGNGGKLARFYKEYSGDATYRFDTYITIESEYGKELNTSFLSNISFSPSTSEMFLYLGDNTVCLKKTGDATYRVAYTVGGDLKLMGKVTMDGMHFITEKSFDRPERGELLILTRNSADEQFSMDNAFILYENTGLGLLQPCYSEAMKAVVLVENKSGGWTENNIYTVPVNIFQASVKFVVPEDIGVEPMYVDEFDVTESIAEDMPVDEIVPVPPPHPANILNRDVVRMETENSVQSTNGVEAVKIAIGKAFPNPTTGIFHIYYQSASQKPGDKTSFEVYSVAGEKVLSQNVVSGNGAASIDLSGLPPGTYSVSAGISGVQSEAIKVVLVK